MTKIALFDTVKPNDDSEVLPRGLYEVDEIKWISYRTVNSHNRGAATFVVVSGPHASSRRRIGCITDDPSQFGREEKS